MSVSIIHISTLSTIKNIQQFIDYNDIKKISGNGGETSWCFSQVKGTLEDEVTDADLISCVEFNHDGELLATGDKGGRVVIFQVCIFFLQYILYLI